MKKLVYVLIGLMVCTGVLSGSIHPSISQAISLAYNFDFDAAGRLLDSQGRQRPDDYQVLIGRLVFDFLRLQQSPRPDLFAVSYANLAKAEDQAKSMARSRPGTEADFFLCMVQYYYMKTYSLDRRWLQTVSAASQSRRLALALEPHGAQFPDILYILGDQDYTATLVPGYLKPLFHAFNFRAGRAAGLANIRRAGSTGYYTRLEAGQLYITLTTYVEKDYNNALAAAEAFLGEAPGNLSVYFMHVDILLRKGELARARQLLEDGERLLAGQTADSKWWPRYRQMQGNLHNAQGRYRDAIALYQQALAAPALSAVSVGEIYLEIGKLQDVLGDRAAALAAYRACEKSSGLELHKEEARQYQRSPWPERRGSY